MSFSKVELKFMVVLLYMAMHDKQSKPSDRRFASILLRKINLAVMAQGGWEKLEEVLV